MQEILYTLLIFPIEGFLSILYQHFLKLFWIDGIAIILLSIAVTVITLPLYNMAESWQNAERDIQKRMKKKIQDIKSVFSGSERHMIIRTYYRQNNYHPIYSLRSVLGLAIQVPFFIAAYHYLSNLESLKGATYYIIADLSKPDSLITISGLTINLMPIIMTVINIASAMVYSKKLNLREQFQLYAMALLFLVLLYSSPAGLVLYWTMNNVCSLVKNIIYLSENRVKIFKRTIYSFIAALFVFSLLLRFPFFKEIAGLYDVKISSIKILRRNLILGVVIILLPVAPALLRYVSNFIDRWCGELFNNPAKRFKIFILSCVVIFLMTSMVIPTSLISSSTQEFSNSFESLTNPLIILKTVSLQALSLFIIFPLSAYFLFKDRIKQNITFIMLFASMMSLVNLYIFRGDYGIIMSNLKFDSPDIMVHSIADIALNIFAAIVIISIIIFAINRCYYKVITTVLGLIALTFIPMIVINSGVIISSHNDYVKIVTSGKSVSVEARDPDPVFNLSKTKKNVIVIMADQAISSYFGEMIQYDPEIKNKLNGFVLYPNTLSFNAHTRLGVPPVFGGYDYTPIEINKRPEITLVEKHNESLLLMPLVFRKYGYNTIFTDASYANYSDTPDNSIFEKQNLKSDHLIGKYSARWIENWNKQNSNDAPIVKKNDYRSFMENNLISFSFFRTAPVFLRKYIYDDGFWHNANYRYNINKSLPSRLIANYSALDYLPEITSYDSNSDELIILVNELSHIPYILHPPDFVPGEKPRADYENNYKLTFNDDVSLERFCVNIATLKKLTEWFDELKKEGVYDNTKIIIVSDHGHQVDTAAFRNMTTDTELNKIFPWYNPLLLVKDFGSKNELSISDKFMTNADVPSIAASHLDNPINPFTENPLNKFSKDNGVEIVTIHRWEKSDHGKYTFTFNDEDVIRVKDNIFEKNNWQGEVK